MDCCNEDYQLVEKVQRKLGFFLFPLKCNFMKIYENGT